MFWARLAGGGMDRSGAELDGTAPDLPMSKGLGGRFLKTEQ